MTILGWTSLVILIFGAVITAFGWSDFNGNTGEAKMGGAIVTMFGWGVLGLGAVLGLIWLVLK